jgi:ketosteroid isomerase-like protein
MKCRRYLLVGAILIVSGLVAPLARAGETGTDATDAAWAKAMKANSLDDIASCYAADAVGWFPNAPEAKGQKAIRARYEGMFTGHTIKDVIFSDRHSHTHGRESTGWGKCRLMVEETSTGKITALPVRFTELAELQNGRWVIVCDHASFEPAPVPAADAAQK